MSEKVQENWAQKSVGNEFLEVQMIQCLSIMVEENSILAFMSGYLKDETHKKQVNQCLQEIFNACADLENLFNIKGVEND